MWITSGGYKVNMGGGGGGGGKEGRKGPDFK